MGKTFLHLNYLHSQAPEGVSEGVPNQKLNRKSQGHPVLLRKFLKNFFSEFFRDFSGLLNNPDRAKKALYQICHKDI